ncbi:MAG: DUF6472 family protein [Oscillospiraceae bacterium]
MGANCEVCENYAWDEECGCYVCDKALDEDEMSRFMRGTFSDCPYFRLYDEYKIVQKQN